MSIARPAITNFRMVGSAGPNLIKKPTFMSAVPTIRYASPYFFSLTGDFILHRAQYVLVHAVLLMSCSGYRLFLLCHPDCLLTMALVSMALPVSCMRSLCKKDSSPNDVVGYAAFCGGEIGTILCGSTC